MSSIKKSRTYANSYEKKTPERQAQLESALDSFFAGKLVKIAPHAWEFGLSYSAKPENFLDICKSLKNESAFDFAMLSDVTAVDWLDSKEQRFNVVYQLLSITNQTRLCLKIDISENKAKVPSVRSIWNSANFLEREVWDMYGIEFEGHGDLRRILMYDEFVGHPLRKDYPIRGKQPRIQMRVPELRNTSQDMEKEQLVSLPVRQRLPKNAAEILKGQKFNG